MRNEELYIEMWDEEQLRWTWDEELLRCGMRSN